MEELEQNDLKYPERKRRRINGVKKLTELSFWSPKRHKEFGILALRSNF